MNTNPTSPESPFNISYQLKLINEELEKEEAGSERHQALLGVLALLENRKNNLEDSKDIFDEFQKVFSDFTLQIDLLTQKFGENPVFKLAFTRLASMMMMFAKVVEMVQHTQKCDETDCSVNKLFSTLSEEAAAAGTEGAPISNEPIIESSVSSFAKKFAGGTDDGSDGSPPVN